jgi:hypothetical protein
MQQRLALDHQDVRAAGIGPLQPGMIRVELIARHPHADAVFHREDLAPRATRRNVPAV